MKRIGMYTGTVYEDGTDLDTIKECCKTCNGEASAADIAKAKSQCAECPGDPSCPKGQTK